MFTIIIKLGEPANVFRLKKSQKNVNKIHFPTQQTFVGLQDVLKASST